MLDETYSNICYQNTTWDASGGLAVNNEPNYIKDKLQHLCLNGYDLKGVSTERQHNSEDVIVKSALQYIENHDHKRFVCNWEQLYLHTNLYGEGNREKYAYKVQPYLIGMMMAKGVPLLWQGQEIGESHYMPEDIYNVGRVVIPRPVRWDFFYDFVGRRVIKLTRKLIKVRKSNPEFTKGELHYYNYEYYTEKNVLFFHRQFEGTTSFVLLNFKDSEVRDLSINPPCTGQCHELIADASLGPVEKDVPITVELPSNYGLILQFAS